MVFKALDLQYFELFCLSYLFLEILLKIRISKQAACWFSDYMASKTQCVLMNSSVFLQAPQGSVLGHILVTSTFQICVQTCQLFQRNPLEM